MRYRLNHFVLNTLLFFGFAGLLSSCVDDELTPKKSVVFVVEADTTNLPVTLSEVQIKITDKAGTSQFTVTTNENGHATVSLVQGLYSVNVSKVHNGFSINGVSDHLLVLSETDTVVIKSAIKPLGQGLIFKEIYYVGSATPAGAGYYSDQYVEIYNNSNDTIYLDGVCFGFIESLSHQVSVWNDAAKNPGLRIPIAQMTWMFPGSGKQNPLHPRQSVLIAQDGINHKSDPNGNANSPVDLSSADFETYFDLSGRDLDNPAVPNLTYIYASTKTTFDWVINSGGQALVMFRLPGGADYMPFVKNSNNFMAKPGSSSAIQFLMVDKRWVIDAVDIVKVESDKQIKQLADEIDAGKVWCTQQRSGTCIRRRVSELDNGVFTFSDTNNSLFDFVNDQVPSPKNHVFVGVDQ